MWFIWIFAARVSWYYWIYGLRNFIRFWKFLTIISSNSVLSLLSFPFPFVIAIIYTCIFWSVIYLSLVSCYFLISFEKYVNRIIQFILMSAFLYFNTMTMTLVCVVAFNKIHFSFFHGLLVFKNILFIFISIYCKQCY